MRKDSFEKVSGDVLGKVRQRHVLLRVKSRIKLVFLQRPGEAQCLCNFCAVLRFQKGLVLGETARLIQRPQGFRPLDDLGDFFLQKNALVHSGDRAVQDGSHDARPIRLSQLGQRALQFLAGGGKLDRDRLRAGFRPADIRKTGDVEQERVGRLAGLEVHSLTDMVEFRVPLHVAEAGKRAALRLPMRLPDPLEVQQLKRRVGEGIHIRDKIVLGEKSAEIGIRHGVSHHMTTVSAVGVVDQKRDGNRFFALLEVHADQTLEGGHALDVQLRKATGQSVELEETRLPHLIVQVVIFLCRVDFQANSACVFRLELVH